MMHRPLNLVLLFSLSFLFGHSQNKSAIDSLDALLKISKPDTNKVLFLNQLCYEYVNSDPNKAIAYGRLGQSLASQLNFKKGVALCLGKIGMIYYNQGEYEHALDHYLKALKINEEINNRTCISDNLCNIGTVYRTEKKYEKALEYQFRALKMDEGARDKYGIATDHTNIGNIYFDAENYQKAMFYYTQALHVFKELSDKQNTATVLNNIGAIYFNRSALGMAIAKFNEALKIHEAEGDKLGVAIDLNNIAQVLTEQKKYEEAIANYKKSLGIAIGIEAKDVQKNNYYGLSEVSAKKNDFSAAYQYHKSYFEISNDIVNSETNSRINEMAIKYETEKKEKENELLRKENATQGNLNQYHHKIANYLLIGLIAVSIAGFWFFNRSRRKQKEAENLEKVVSMRTAELKSQNKQKELMLQEIHHRVKNNLQLISSLLRLQTNFKRTQDFDEIVRNCNDRIKCMAILHDKLCQANDYSEINSQEYFSELANYVAANYNNVVPNTQVEVSAPPLTLHINKLIPCGLILNELVSNAFKYAFKEGSEEGAPNLIRISFRKNEADNFYCLTISDNGKGFPESFDVNSQGGLGLTIVQSLVEQLDGKLHLERSGGTTLSIAFPH